MPHIGFSRKQRKEKREEAYLSMANHKPGILLCTYIFFFIFLLLQFHEGGTHLPNNLGRTDVEAKTPILWPPHVKS